MFENSTVNITALCNSCEDMACCSSERVLTFPYAGDNTQYVNEQFVSCIQFFFLYTSLFIKPHKQKSNGVVSWDTLYSSVTACHQTGKHASNQPTNQPINTTPQYLTRTALSRETESSSLRRAFRLRSDSAVQRLL